MGTDRKFENIIRSMKKRATIPDQKYIDDTIKSLSSALELYDEEYNNKKYELQFTNKERLDFQIDNQRLAHMLGVNGKHILKKTSLYRRDSDIYVGSYQLLKRIVENPRPLQELNQHRNGSLINYYKVRQRCWAFRNFYELEKFDFFGVDFDKEKIRNESHKTLIRSNKLLVFDSKEKDISYYMMGIALDERSKSNYVETIFPVYGNDLNERNNPNRFIENQRILIPSQISTTKNFEDEKCSVNTLDECYCKEDVIDYLTKLKRKIKLKNLKIDDSDYNDFDLEEYNEFKRVI